MVAVYMSLPIWCFITWYSACIVLQIDPIKGSLDRMHKEKHVSLSLIFPKVLGIMPCFILAYAFSSLETPTDYNNVTLLRNCSNCWGKMLDVPLACFSVFVSLSDETMFLHYYFKCFIRRLYLCWFSLFCPISWQKQSAMFFFLIIVL